MGLWIFKNTKKKFCEERIGFFFFDKWCYPHAKERIWTLISQNTQNLSQNES